MQTLLDPWTRESRVQGMFWPVAATHVLLLQDTAALLRGLTMRE
jgi:hypothetical protein